MTSLKTISVAVFEDSEPLARTVRWRTVAKTLLMGWMFADDPSVRRANRRTPATHFDLSSGSRLPWHTSRHTFRRRRHCDLGRGPAGSEIDFAQDCLHAILHRFRHLVENVGCLVHPASLVFGAGKKVIERLPEPGRIDLLFQLRRALELRWRSRTEGTSTD